MTFQPIVPFGGIAGFNYIERTQEAQQAVFNRSPVIARELDYFRENIANALTAEDLVNDRTLRKVALGAFGLDEDIDKIFFIKKVLDEGTEQDRAFATRLVDPAYRNLADAFGYGNLLGARVGQSDFASNIINAYQDRQFEIAVGNSDNGVRLAMNFKREIAAYAASENPETSAWFQIMGNTPIRTVIEGALGLPTSIGSLEIDKQRQFFQDAALKTFGGKGVDVFLDSENVEKAINNFLVRDQISNGISASTPGSAALTLLQNASFSTANLLLSNA
jgi:hypothetical protein